MSSKSKKTTKPVLAKTPAPAPAAVVAAKPRTMAEIEKEYTDLSNAVGDRSYRAEVLKGEISSIWNRMFQLNQEATALKALAAQKQLEEASNLPSKQ